VIDRIKRWTELHPYWLLTLVAIAALAPFLAKPFNIDDPLFIWAAKQIRAHPGDPYGFNVEWGWTSFPMWKVTENPPLVCYFIALSSTLFGWNETGLHLAFLLPATAAILGSYRLAKHFCGRPLLASLLVLFAPVFMVSSLTVMCDVTMLALWIWAVVFWTEGMGQGKAAKLVAATILVALAELTKYYGACLLPLLAIHGLISRRPLRQWGAYLTIPVAVLCAYQYATHVLYGRGLLYRAADYASFSKTLYGFSKSENGLTALAFTGGCLASAVFFIPLCWRKREWAIPAVGSILLTSIVFSYTTYWNRYSALHGANLMSAQIQMIFWATAGLCVLGLVVADLLRHRDVRSLLLFLWVAGTFFFAAFCNWTVNARSILPMTPAVAILVVRRLETTQPKTWSPAVITCLVASYGLAWFVTMSDFSIAGACRQGAQEICDKYGGGRGTLWFQGHWGFQYYMQQLGASPMDFKNSPLKPGDLLVVPANNTNILPPDAQKSELLETFTIPGAQGMATFNPSIGGGFYASAIAPLPFAFGSVPPDQIFVYALKFPPGKPGSNSE
jgi:4-amino-4-deoxy-L-arabinose transferase-like glycosyltransferase